MPPFSVFASDTLSINSDIVHRILTSSSPPSEEERLLLRQALARAQILKEELNLQLESLQPSGIVGTYRFNQVEHRLRSTRKLILSVTRALSAQRRIPVEVWMLIFEYANDPYILDSWASRPHISSFRVSQVCQAWRALALGMPSLWTTLDVAVDAEATVTVARTLPESLKAKASGKKNIKSTKYCDFIGELLQRSASRDLRLYVYAPDQSFSNMGRHPVLHLLAPHLHRCSHLTIQSTSRTAQAVFVSPHWRLETTANKQALRLRALRLQIYPVDAPYTLLNLRIFPFLDHVELVNIRSGHIYTLPWTQLRTFKQISTGRPNDVSIGNILPHLSRVVSLAHDHDVYHGAPNQPHSIVTMSPQTKFPELKSLDINITTSYGYNPPTSGIFSDLNFTSLLNLRVRSFPGDVLEEIVHTVTILHPVKYLQLTKVVFGFLPVEVSSGLLESFLQLTPCLEVLDIMLPPSDALDCLMSTSLVPLLAHLTLRSSSPKSIKAVQSVLRAIGANRFSRDRRIRGNKNLALKRYSIVLTRPGDAYNVLPSMNMWPVDDTESQPFLRIVEWRLQLIQLVATISKDISYGMWAKTAERLHNLITETEVFQPQSGHDISNLFVSADFYLLKSVMNRQQAHVTYQQRSRISEPLLVLRSLQQSHLQFYSVKRHTFIERSEALLQRWKVDICNRFIESETQEHFMVSSDRVLEYFVDAPGRSTLSNVSNFCQLYSHNTLESVEWLMCQSIEDLFGEKASI